MTAEELERLVLESEDPWAVQRAFAGFNEKGRKALSSPAQKLHRQLIKGVANAGASRRLQRHLALRTGDVWKHYNSQANRNALLAIYATGPLSALRGWQASIPHGNREVVEQIIEDRRPDWLDAWIDQQLTGEWTALQFTSIRRWMKSGACRKPTADKYYGMFAAYLARPGLPGGKSGYIPALSEQLLAEPELMEDIEGLFRVETFAFNTNAWLTKGAPAHYETWTQALIKLSAAGKIDRAALLDMALAGLKRDLKQNQLSGYHKFIRQLQPTTAELDQRQSALVDLLCHPVGHVAGFGIEMLAKLEGAKSLDDRLVLRELPTVFTRDGKGNGVAALRLVEKVLKRTANAGKGMPDSQALAVAIEALRHASGDVQAKAIALVHGQAAAVNEGQWQVIAACAPFVAASNRSALAALLQQSPTSFEPATGAASASPTAMEVAESYCGISPPFAEQMVLFDDLAIAPVTTLDQLIDLAFHCVEVVDHVDEIERLIDGISRLANLRPQDFDRRVEPLIHRLTAPRSGARGLAVAYPGIAEAVRALLATWATGRLHGSAKYDLRYYAVEDAFVPAIAHIHTIAQRVSRYQARELLATATHRGGWIDPLVWIGRLQRVGDAAEALRSMDFRLSLLRLAPQRRAEALALAADLPGDIGRVARFALGGDELPSRPDGKDYGAWITAARAREPDADWRTLAECMVVRDPWPGGAAPVVYNWHTGLKERSQYNNSWKETVFTVSATSQSAESERPRRGFLQRVSSLLGAHQQCDWRQLPGAAIHRLSSRKYAWASELNNSWVAQWLAYQCPLDPAYSLYQGAQRLVQRVDENASSWTPAHAFFEPLFVRGRPWGEAGHLLVCLGLVGKDADARGLAIDALIEGVDSRIFHPALFADVLSRVANGGWLKPNRLGASLIQVLQTSPVHAQAIDEALQQFLPRFDLAQRNAFHLLEALAEAQAISRRPLKTEVRFALETIQGEGKVKKLARQLIGVTVEA